MSARQLAGAARTAGPVRDSMWVITDAVRELFPRPSLPDLDCWIAHVLSLVMAGGSGRPGSRPPRALRQSMRCYHRSQPS